MANQDTNSIVSLEDIFPGKEAIDPNLVTPGMESPDLVSIEDIVPPSPSSSTPPHIETKQSIVQLEDLEYNPFEDPSPPAQEPSSIFSEIGEFIQAGAEGVLLGPLEGAETYSRVADLIGIPGARSAVDYLDKTKKGFYDEPRDYWDESVMSGVSSSINSILTGAPGAVAGTLSGGPWGQVAGYALSSGTLFSLSEYHRFMDSVVEYGKSEGMTDEDIAQFKKEVVPEAIVSAVAEGGIEALQSLVLGKVFGFVKNSKTLTAPAKKNIKQMGMDFLKKLGITSPVEVGGEEVTTVIQHMAGESANLPQGELWDAMKQTFGPAMVQVFLMGMGGQVVSGRYEDTSENRNILRTQIMDLVKQKDINITEDQVDAALIMLDTRSEQMGVNVNDLIGQLFADVDMRDPQEAEGELAQRMPDNFTVKAIDIIKNNFEETEDSKKAIKKLKTLGVSKGEMEWFGLEEFIESHYDNEINRDELIEYLEFIGNQGGIEEEVYSSNHDEQTSAQENVRNKAGQYDAFVDKKNKINSTGPSLYDGIGVNKGPKTEYREIILHVLNETLRKLSTTPINMLPDFKTSKKHFTFLNHVIGFAKLTRRSERTEASIYKGSSFTFIEEIQSDVHQEGAAKGYGNWEDIMNGKAKIFHWKRELIDMYVDYILSYPSEPSIRAAFEHAVQTNPNLTIKDLMTIEQAQAYDQVRNMDIQDIINEITAGLEERGRMSIGIAGMPDDRIPMNELIPQEITDRIDLIEKSYYDTLDNLDKAAPLPMANRWIWTLLRRSIVDAIQNGDDYIAWSSAENRIKTWGDINIGWMRIDKETIGVFKASGDFDNVSDLAVNGELILQIATRQQDKNDVEEVNLHMGNPDYVMERLEQVLGAYGVSQRASKLFQMIQESRTENYSGNTKPLGAFFHHLYDNVIPSIMKKITGEEIVELNSDMYLTLTDTAEEGPGYLASQSLYSIGKVKAIPLTDAVREKMLKGQQHLMQGEKGSVEFLEDGRAVLRMAEGADISTLIHEIGHIFRRTLTPNKLKEIEEWAGVKNGVWTVDAEEKFARGFERWARTGTIENEELHQTFDNFKKWMSKIYKRIKGSPIEVKLSRDMRNFFSRMFDKPSLESVFEGRTIVEALGGQYILQDVEEDITMISALLSSPEFAARDFPEAVKLISKIIESEFEASGKSEEDYELFKEAERLALSDLGRMAGNNIVRKLSPERTRIQLEKVRRALETLTAWIENDVYYHGSEKMITRLTDGQIYMVRGDRGFAESYSTGRYGAKKPIVTQLRIKSGVRLATVEDYEQVLANLGLNIDDLMNTYDSQADTVRDPRIREALIERGFDGVDGLLDFGFRENFEEVAVTTVFNAKKSLELVHNKKKPKRHVTDAEIIKLQKESPGVFEAAKMLRNYFDSMREEIKDYKKDMFLRTLPTAYRDAFEEAIIVYGEKGDISQQDYDRIIKRFNVKEELFKEYVKEFTEIDNWGIDDYITNMERGSIRLVDEDGNVVAVGVSKREAIKKAKRYLEENPDTRTLVLDTSSVNFDPMAELSRVQYWMIRRKIESTLGKIQSDLGEALGKGIRIKPSYKFAGPLQRRKDVIKGEANIFDAVFTYSHVLRKKMAVDRVVLQIRNEIGGLPKNVREMILKQAEYAKGKYSFGDRIVDDLTNRFGFRPMLYTRMIGKIRKVFAGLKLGYRPVASFINYVSGQGHTWVKFGHRYMSKANAFLKTDKGKDFLARQEKYLGTTFAIDAETKKATRGVSLWHPLGMFSAAELPNRKRNVAAAYLYAKDEGMGEAEAEEFARRSVRLTQFTYNMTSLPAILRSPSGKLFGQFKPYLVKEIEFITGLKGSGQILKYFGLQMALAGPRGLLWMIRSIPMLGLLGLWDDVEEWMNKPKTGIPLADDAIPTLSRGVVGMIGGDITMPATVQLPNRPEDWAGPFFSDLIRLYVEVARPWMEGEKYMEMSLINWAARIAPATYYWDQMVQSVIDKDGWVKDRESGNKLYRVESNWERILLSMGVSPISRSEALTAQRLLRKEEDLRNRNARKSINKLITIIKDKKEVPVELMEDMLRMGISRRTIRSAIIRKELPPQLREVKSARKQIRPRVFELYE